MDHGRDPDASMTMSDRLRAPIHLDAEGGEAIQLQGGLCIIKATGEQTAEQFSLAEQIMPQQMCTPIHVQPDEDEVFYVLEGRMTFYLDGAFLIGDPGSVIGIPRGTSHGFRVDSTTARFLVLNTPAGHERWFRAAGRPATSLTLPAEAPDAGRIADASSAFGITVVGPFPENGGTAP